MLEIAFFMYIPIPSCILNMLLSMSEIPQCRYKVGDVNNTVRHQLLWVNDMYFLN